MKNIFIRKKRILLKLLFCLAFLFTFLTPALPVAAEDSTNDKTYRLQVDIPGTNREISMSEPGTAIGSYVSAIYSYAIGIVGILAALVIMLGGVIWLTAGGNTNRIENAKSWITAALTGLVVALSSYLILYIINPDLVEFRTMKPETPQSYETGCCETGDSCESIIIEEESDCPGEYYANKICKGGKCVSAQAINCLYAVDSTEECEEKCGEEDPLISTAYSSDNYICCNCGLPETNTKGEECDYIVGDDFECEDKCESSDIKFTPTGEPGYFCCQCNE